MQQVQIFWKTAFFVILIASKPLYAQETTASLSASFGQGAYIPNYANFSAHGVLSSASLQAIWSNKEYQKGWRATFPNIETGLSARYIALPNSSVMGSEWSILPFYRLAPIRSLPSLKFSIGLGASAFTKKFDEIENAVNRAVSTRFTWAFQSGLQFTPRISNEWLLQFNVDFIHASNGHIKMPNYGLNGIMLSGGVRYDLSEKTTELPSGSITHTNHQQSGKLEWRYGMGFQAYGGSKAVLFETLTKTHTLAVDYWLPLKPYLYLKSGLFYRYYEGYEKHIALDQPSLFIAHPFRNASNFGGMVGFECIAGRIGMEAQVGLNISKPFYNYYFDALEVGKPSMQIKKSKIINRLGLKCYILQPGKSPKVNAYVGAHLNANYGQADFTEINMGLVYDWKTR